MDFWASRVRICLLASLAMRHHDRSCRNESRCRSIICQSFHAVEVICRSRSVISHRLTKAERCCRQQRVISHRSTHNHVTQVESVDGYHVLRPVTIKNQQQVCTPMRCCCLYNSALLWSEAFTSFLRKPYI